jgi:hypothetical protein
MFGFVKKETVEEMVTKEVNINREMYEKCITLRDACNKSSEQGECHKTEVERYTQMADEYFARYQQSKEILSKLKNL